MEGRWRDWSLHDWGSGFQPRYPFLAGRSKFRRNEVGIRFIQAQAFTVVSAVSSIFLSPLGKHIFVSSPPRGFFLPFSNRGAGRRLNFPELWLSPPPNTGPELLGPNCQVLAAGCPGCHDSRGSPGRSKISCGFPNYQFKFTHKFRVHLFEYNPISISFFNCFPGKSLGLRCFFWGFLGDRKFGAVQHNYVVIFGPRTIWIALFSPSVDCHFLSNLVLLWMFRLFSVIL